MGRSTVAIVAIILAIFAVTVFAQTAPPAFDVASVKPVEGPYAICSPCFGRPKPEIIDAPGRVYIQWIALSDLIFRAFFDWNYDCKFMNCPQYQGQVVLPAWIVADGGHRIAFYEINATMPVDTSQENRQLMLRSLLAERFHMTFHYEKRDTPVYALKIADSGLLIHPAPTPPPNTESRWNSSSDGYRLFDGPPDPKWPDWRGTLPPDTKFAGGMKLSAIVVFLRNRAHFDRPVADLTGLEGYYDINVFIPFEREGLVAAPSAAGTGEGPASGARVMSDHYSVSQVSAALKKQLGLELKKETDPMDVLVIDHLDSVPVPN